MKRTAISLLRAILPMACAFATARAADADTFSPVASYQYPDALSEPGTSTTVNSPVVSYQYLDSLDEPGTQTTVSSAVVSYQYFDWPGDANLTFTDSPTVSYSFQYPAALAVVPDRGTAFGSVRTGGTRDQTFTLKNSSNSTIAGTISIAAPFSVVGGNSYSLVPGESKTVTVRFSPTAPGAYSAYLSFSNGSSWLLTASAFADFAATTGAITGRITAAGTGAPLNGVTITAIGSGPNLFNGGSSLGDYSGSNGSKDGRYTITGLLPYAYYHILALAPGQQYYSTEVTGVAIVAGQTTPLDIALDPVPAASQPPPQSLEDTPVVLVRGTGSDTNWDAGESQYWSVFRTALEGKFNYVWDCNKPDPDNDLGKAANFPVYDGYGHVINGEYSVEDNAHGLEYYIEQKAKQYKRDNPRHTYPTTINIVAHSMGGLITRRAMEPTGTIASFVDEATGQWVRINVGKVVMLGTPNAGTVAANVVLEPFPKYTPFGFWLHSYWAATKDLATYNIQNQFNPSHPWPAGVQLFLYAGTGGPGGSGNTGVSLGWNLGFSYASLAMKELHLFLPPEKQDDGVVTAPSVRGLYYRRLLNLQLKEEQSFVGASPIEVNTDPEVNHFGMLSYSATVDWVLQKLGAGVISAAPASRIGSPLAAMASVGNAPVESSLSMQQLEQAGGELALGTAEVPVISDASTKLRFQLGVSSALVGFRLKDPFGATISADTPLTNANVHYSEFVNDDASALLTFEIASPAKGTWMAIVGGGGVIAPQASYRLTVFGDSDTILVSQTAVLFNKGQEALISCVLGDLGPDPVVPVQNASISALVQLPDGTKRTVSLVDDGLHNDGAPNDGDYAAALPALAQAGQYLITYAAMGQNSQGQALQRVASGAFNVSSSNATIVGDPVFAMVDTDGDGVADALRAKCGVNPLEPGNYIISGQLVDAAATLRIPASAHFYSDASGPMMASVFFDLSQVKAAGLTGDFHLENLQLFEVPSSGATWVDSYRGTAVTQIAFGPSITTQAHNLTTVSGGQASFTVGATGSGPLAFQWQRSTDGGANWINLTDDDTYSGTHSATLSVANTSSAMDDQQFRAVVTNSVTSTTSTAVLLTVVVAPSITTQPVSQTVNAGEPVTFTVVATGAAPLSYQWRKGGVARSEATDASLTLTNVQPADSGSYDVVVSNGVNPNATSDPAALNVVPTGVSATHAGVSYLSNGTTGTFSVSNRFTYAGTVTNLRWSVLLPVGWSFASSDASGTDVQPAAGATSLLEWKWSTLPPSPIAFTYSLNLPTSDVAPQPLAALVNFDYEGIPIQIMAKPDPLMAGPRHSADTNRDSKLSLPELLRVIELYNTRYGTVRTGAYVVDAGNLEDGFGTDPARSNTAVVTLPRYHSGDSNHDGKLSLTELLRVIELYNTRSGTVRTGEYHVQAGTEDGFAPGP